MVLSIYSRRIDEILGCRERNAPRADLLFDQYTMLKADEDREAFVAALIHRVLTERARRADASCGSPSIAEIR
jgi:hypothetical protein